MSLVRPNEWLGTCGHINFSSLSSTLVRELDNFAVFKF